MQELSDKHRFTVLAKTSRPYHLTFEGVLYGPTLDKHIIQWRDKEGKPFPPEDLVPQRVGVLRGSKFGAGILSCAGVSWAQHTIQRNPEIFNSLSYSEKFRTLAVSCLLKSGDNRFILAKRSARVSVYANLWHVSAAGWVDLDTAFKTRGVIEQVYTELKEEVNLDCEHVLRLDQLGLCVHLAQGSNFMEICFLAETKLESQVVLELAQDAKDRWEGKYHIFNQSELEGMIAGNEVFNPAGAATIMMALDIPFS